MSLDENGVDRLTNSEMTQYQRCRRKWWLGTYRRLERRGRGAFNAPLSIGDRVHFVLSQYYLPGYDRDPEFAMRVLHGSVWADLLEFPTDAEDILKEEELCEAMLETYFDWLEETGIDQDFNVIAPESEEEVPLADGATLLSKIDVMIEKVEGGDRGNLEHKTVGGFKDPVKTLQVDPQLLTEHLVQFMKLLGESDGDPEANRAKFVLYNMIKKNKRTKQAKPPFFEREEVHHNVEELRSHWKHCVGIAGEIARTRSRLDAGEDPHVVCPPNVIKRNCEWSCPFSEPCLAGMFDDGSDVETYLAETYKEGDPLARYMGEALSASESVN